MSHAARLIFKFLLLTGPAAMTAACSVVSKKDATAPAAARQRVFNAEYESVWRALQQAIVRYPMRISSIDYGLYETDYIRSDKAWSPPGDFQKRSPGYRYRLVIRVLKGKSTDKPATKVSISKIAELQRDFFTDTEPIPSDGLEELTVLYRIQRELAIEKAILRAQEKSNQAGSTGQPGAADQGFQGGAGGQPLPGGQFPPQGRPMPPGQDPFGPGPQPPPSNIKPPPNPQQPY